MIKTERRTILLVEDNPNDALLIQRAFQKTNKDIPIQVVTDGVKAVEYLSGEGAYANRDEHPFPHLILLDLKLPRQSGFEVLTWLRQQSGLKLVPVIILTSSREASDVEKAYQLGVNSYLVKPTAFDQLLEMTERLEHFWLDLNQFPDITVD